MKKFEILQESPKCDRDTNWANAVGKMVLIHFLEAGLPWMFNLFKKKKKKRSTICEAQSNQVCLYFWLFPYINQHKSGHGWELCLWECMFPHSQFYWNWFTCANRNKLLANGQDSQVHHRLLTTTGLWAPNPSEESKKKATQRKPGFAYFYHSVIKTIVSSLSHVINVFYQLPMQSVTTMNKFAFLTKIHLETK